MHFSVLVVGDNVDDQLEPFSAEASEDPRLDWFQIGGRWSESLKLKPEFSKGRYAEGERSWTNEKEPLKEGWVDSAKVVEIDFDGMTTDGEKFQTAAIVVNGEWYDIETVGADFPEFYTEVIGGLSPEETVTIVDCHY